MKSNNGKVKLVLVILLALLVLIPSGWILWHRLEGNNPEIQIEFLSPFIGLSTTFSGKVLDPESGLRKVWVGLIKDGKETVLYESSFPAQSAIQGGSVREAPVVFTIDPKKRKLADGKTTLRIAAWDYSWRNWWSGNQTYLEKELTIDTRPPEIEMLSRVHNISQGGTGLVIYRVPEKNTRSGIVVGHNFFPGYNGYFQRDDLYLAFIALDHLQGLQTKIYATVTDRAGNTTRSGFPYYLKKRNFRKDNIRISDRFLNWKMPEFNVKGPNGETFTGIDKFLIVNRKIRKQNTDFFWKIAEKTESEKLWEGSFLRMPRAANRAQFADRRSYFYKGKVVDHQYHMGMDLASTAHSPIPAANRGKVVFTGENGIYGKTVVLDHGFGLFSLYSHLSQIQVQTGEMVPKGHVLGRSGTTGMAGGDHLHFGMIVHNTFVSPREWWDGTWIEHNITSKLQEFQGGMSQ